MHFVADHDPNFNVMVGPLQQHPKLLAKYGIPLDLDTVILIQKGGFVLGEKVLPNSTFANEVVNVMRLLPQTQCTLTLPQHCGS